MLLKRKKALADGGQLLCFRRGSPRCDGAAVRSAYESYSRATATTDAGVRELRGAYGGSVRGASSLAAEAGAYGVSLSDYFLPGPEQAVRFANATYANCQAVKVR